MNNSSSFDEIRKSLIVACNLEMAFRTWVELVDMWWPKQHSRSGQLATTVFIEPYAGGRFYERTSAGVEHIWGEVTAWNPPYSFAFDWYLGSSQAQPTRVDVQFTAITSASTQIEIRHYGAEQIGERWLETSSIFDRAWNTVLIAFHGFQTSSASQNT
jgi:hypothetical protein